MTCHQTFFWRARAYQGTIFGPDSPAPEVAQISGQASVESDWNDDISFNERVVSHVCRAIRAQLDSSCTTAFDLAATLKSFMTVSIEMSIETASERNDVWNRIARLDLISDGHAVHAGIWLEDAGDRILPTVLLQDRATVWPVFVELLGVSEDVSSTN
jgi:hypothetical protein